MAPTPPVPPIAQPIATGGSFSVLVAGLLATHARPAPPPTTSAQPPLPVPALPLDRQDVAGQETDARADEDDAAPIIVDLALFDSVPVMVAQPVPTTAPVAMSNTPTAPAVISNATRAAEPVAVPAPIAAPEGEVPSTEQVEATLRSVSIERVGESTAARDPVAPRPVQFERVVQLPPAATPLAASAPAPAAAAQLSAPVASVAPVRTGERKLGADLRAMLKAFAPTPASAAPRVQPEVPVTVVAEAPRAAPMPVTPEGEAVILPTSVATAAPVAPKVETVTLPTSIAAAVPVAPMTFEAGDGVVSETPVAAVAAPAAPIAVREAAIVQRMPTVDTGRAEWIETLVDRIDDARAQGAGRITQIRLMPDALGTVEVRIQQDADRVHVQFSTDTAQARTLLIDAQTRLADLAEARGLKLGDTGVHHGTGGQRQADRNAPEADQTNRLVAEPDLDDPTDESGERIA